MKNILANLERTGINKEEQDAVEDGKLHPRAATWRTGWSMHRLWFWPIHSTMWKHDIIHKTGST